MGNLGFSEILIVLLVVIIFFGAKRIPELGKAIGKGIFEFKKEMNGSEKEKLEAKAAPVKADIEKGNQNNKNV